MLYPAKFCSWDLHSKPRDHTTVQSTSRSALLEIWHVIVVRWLKS